MDATFIVKYLPRVICRGLAVTALSLLPLFGIPAMQAQAAVPNSACGHGAQFNAAKKGKSGTPQPSGTTLSAKSVTINNKTFKIELARTREEQQKGLSNRASLPEEHGMLFLFDKPAPYGFWMKGMRFSLDIIFIKDKIVVTVDKNLPVPVPGIEYPPVYYPEQPVNMVLEINAGLAKKYGIKIGDTIKINKNL